jgi:2-polyprenyl-6-methoxyphenol hydroxylase-like FAD-dependent oxidoreductase
MTPRTVLISGAGIAGCTLAYWLARRGMRVTVVERSAAQRSSGAPVDVRGPAADVAERMGITEELRQAQTDVGGMRFVTAQGTPAARVDLAALRRRAGGARDIEVPRGALAAILAAVSRSDAEFIYDDQVQSLAQALADALGEHADFATALREYQSRHHTMVMPRQKSMTLGASLLVPRTRLGLRARNLAVRLVPLAAPVWASRRRTARA